MRPPTETAAEIEHDVLSTEPGRALLERVASIEVPSPRNLAAWREIAPAEAVSAALRIVATRRRGAAKFSRADRMWFDPVALEQATSETVARHKAARFAGADVFDLCCGIGGDAIAIAERARRVVAVDRDLGMVRRTLWNAKVYDEVEHGEGFVDSGATVRTRPVIPASPEHWSGTTSGTRSVSNGISLMGVLGRAERIAIPREALVHIDPDRRSSGGPRSKAIAGYAPGLEFLRTLPNRCRGGAIKIGPAGDFAEHFGGQAWEIEVVSLGGECKEATIWFGDRAGCRRRATALPSGATWTDQDGDGRAPFAEIGPWIFDPDPALIRAGLLDGFASAHGLARFEPGVELLTGPEPVASPFLAAIAVDSVHPLDRKGLRRIVRERRLGPLEIKTRGLDLRPEEIRRELRPEGPNPATMVLVGGRGRGRAIVGRRPGSSGALP